MTRSRDRSRLYGLALREGALALRSTALRLVPAGLGRTTPRRLLIAPQDLCTSDPTVASQAILPLVAAAGVALARFERARPSLEDIFLRLVGDDRGVAAPDSAEPEPATEVQS